MRDKGEKTSQSSHQTDLTCRPSLKPRVWSIHEQIAKMSLESEIGTRDFQCTLSKDTFDDISELGYEFQNADSRLQKEFYCAVALASLRKDMETLKQILSCDPATDDDYCHAGIDCVINGSCNKEKSETEVKNRTEIKCAVGSSQKEPQGDMHDTGQFNNFDVENHRDITPRLVREALSRADDDIDDGLPILEVGCALNGRNQKYDCTASAGNFDMEAITVEEADRRNKQVSYRQVDLGRKKAYVDNSFDDSKKEKDSIAGVSEDILHEVAEYVSKQSIESAIYKLSLTILIDKNKEIKDYCLKLTNELEMKQNENDRLREELKSLQSKKNAANVLKVDRATSEETTTNLFERRGALDAFTKTDKSNDVTIKEDRFDYSTESLHPIAAELIVSQSIKYAIKTIEMAEKLSKEVCNWNEVVDMWRLKVEDERRDKVKAYDMLESNERRIDMIMNDLNVTKGSLEQSKEAFKQEKVRVKGLISQNEKLESKIASMKEEMQQKAKEKEELENLCLELTKTCDIMIEKCHLKDETFILLKGELKSASDEVIVSKDKIIKHEFDLGILNNAMAKLITMYSIRYALQSIEASEDKDRIEQLESDFQTLAQKQDEYLKRLDKNQSSDVHLTMERAPAEKDTGQFSVNKERAAPLIAAVARDSMGNDNMRVSGDLIERSRERGDPSRRNGNSITLSNGSSSNDKLAIIGNEFTSKHYTDFAKLIVNQSVNEAVRAFRSGNYISFINHRLKLERMKSSRKQKQIADFLASNQSLQQENKQLKREFERVLTISNRILKEYCSSFMKMISNFNCHIELKNLNDMKKQLSTFTEKCMNENFSRFILISPNIGNTLVNSESYNTSSKEDHDGRMVAKRQPLTRTKPYVMQNTDGAKYMECGSEKQSKNISEVESCLHNTQRLIAKYICDIAVSRALMRMGIESDEILEYYLDKKDNQYNQKFNISFEKEANFKETMLVVTDVNEGPCMSEKQQQMLTILEQCDPLLLHEMESLEDLFSRFRTAKLVHNYSQQPDYRGYNSPNSSELEFERFSQESLMSAFEEGIGEVESPHSAEDCFGFATLVMTQFMGLTI